METSGEDIVETYIRDAADSGTLELGVVELFDRRR